MDYRMLRCNWGHGMPDPYSRLNEKRIVIFANNPIKRKGA